MTNIRATIENVCAEVVKGIAQANFNYAHGKFTTRIDAGVTVDITMHDADAGAGTTDGSSVTVAVKGIQIAPYPGTDWVNSCRKLESGLQYVD